MLAGIGIAVGVSVILRTVVAKIKASKLEGEGKEKEKEKGKGKGKGEGSDTSPQFSSVHDLQQSPSPLLRNVLPHLGGVGSTGEVGTGKGLNAGGFPNSFPPSISMPNQMMQPYTPYGSGIGGMGMGMGMNANANTSMNTSMLSVPD